MLLSTLLAASALAALWLVWKGCRLASFSPGQGVAGAGGAYAAPTVTPVAGSSGAVAATATTATLTAVAGKTTYIEGFDLLGLGATGASNISVTITGLLGGTLTIGVAIPAGATVSINAGAPAGFSFRFPTPLPASAPNTNVVVNVPSFGTGNTYASVTAYGFNT